MNKQEPTFDSAAAGAEDTAAAEAKTGPAAESVKAAEPEAVSPNDSGEKSNVTSFPLTIYKPSAQYRRFALLAASLFMAAALGGLIGSITTFSFATPKTDPAEPARNLQAALTQVTKDVAALKASVDGSSRTATTQISKLSERFDRTEKAQAEPMAKISALTETVSRLEKRITANADAARDITGSVPDRAAAAAPAKDASKPIIVEGWVLRDVYRGRAMVENRSGLYEVVPGADLPGIGKVQTITQQNGRWVVVTPKGLIVSMR